MTSIKVFLLMICVAGMATLAGAQSTPPAVPASTPPRVSPADAKDHIGDTATVCGKVVDNKISKYGMSGRGKPVFFDLDQPQPNPVFYFVAFGAQPEGPQEVIDAYQGVLWRDAGPQVLYKAWLVLALIGGLGLLVARLAARRAAR